MCDGSGYTYQFSGGDRDGRSCRDGLCLHSDVVLHVLPPVEWFTHKEVGVWISLDSVAVVST